MAEVTIDPDKVAALAQEMLSLSMRLSSPLARVGASDISGDLGKPGQGSSLAGTYTAAAQSAVSAVDALSGALELNAEYVSYAAQQGDDAYS